MRSFAALLAFVLLPGAASALTVNGSTTNPTCTNANGSITTSPTGGTPPYTFVWTPVPPNGQGTSQATGLVAGSYSVTVTDALATQATQNFTLVGTGLNVESNWTWVYDNSAAHHPCPGFQNGSVALYTSLLNGTPPYTTDMNGLPPLGYDINNGNPYFGYFWSTDLVYINVTDAMGCSGFAQVMSDSPPSLGASASNINPACGGLANGSAELTFGYAGPYGPSIWVFENFGAGSTVFNEQNPWEPLLLTGLQAGSYTVYGQYSPLYFGPPGCDFQSSFTIPDLGPDCGSVSGRVFIDNNQNCVQNAGEPSVPFRVLEILPGPQYVITDGNGDYTRNLVNGNFTLEAQGTGTDLYPICPPTAQAPFTVNYNNVTLNLADSSLIPLDLRVIAYANVARPGFAHSIYGNVRNLSARISGPVTLTVTFDAVMSFISATPAPTSVNGNVITWDLGSFGAYAFANFNVTVQVPPDVGLIGQPFSHSISASQPLTEATLANNAAFPAGVYQGSYDPNDKRAFTSTGLSDELYFIGQDSWIDYVIRFQNTGTDTAFNVVVTDTLAAGLDMASFDQGVASHPFSVEFKDGRVVEWRFSNILLPDSNVNEAASHGLVSFRIKPVLPLLPGMIIENEANIYFDFNEPVITDPSVLFAEFSTGLDEVNASQRALQVFPNPASAELIVIINSEFVRDLRVLSMDGRVVRAQRATGSRVTVDVSQLRSGPYLIEAFDGSGMRMVTNFIRQ